jgi:DnaJ homolog subfamily C member 19
MRYLIIIAVACVFCRWAFGKWPWEFLRPTPTRSQAVFRARKLLGVEAGVGRDEITTLVHPDKGGTTAAMQEANAARDLLLDELPGYGEIDPSDPSRD